MDNGLIFPYPRERAHADPGDAKPARFWFPFGEKEPGGRPRLAVGKLKG